MIVQMSARAGLGRFGNQLFGYFFLKTLQAELGCEVRFPLWLGNAFFSIPRTAGLLPPDESICFEALPKPDGFMKVHEANRENGPDAEIAAVRGYAEANTGVLEMAGRFQYHTANLAKRKAMFLATYKTNPHLESQVQGALTRFGLSGHPIVCVHVRRGDDLDQGAGREFRWSNSFDAIVRTVNELKSAYYKNFFIYLCSDELDHCKRELQARGLVCITSPDLIGHRDASLELMVDHLVMTRSEVLMIANSSFSFSAAMLNCTARIFLRPSPTEDRYLPFDPWNSHVLLPKCP